MSEATTWLDGFKNAEVRSHIQTKGYADLDALGNAYISAEKAIGADKLVLPGKDAKPEDWAKWDGWGRLGRPETPEGYELKAPDGWKHPFDTERAQRVAARAHKLGISKAQLQGLFAGEMEDFQSFLTRRESDASAAKTALARTMDEKWGAAKADKQKAAKAFAKHVGFTVEQLDKLESVMGDFAMLDTFARLAETLKVGEDGLVTGDGPRRGTMTPDEAKAEIARLKADDKSGYWDRDHVAHATTVKRVEELHALAFPDAGKAA